MGSSDAPAGRRASVTGVCPSLVTLMIRRRWSGVRPGHRAIRRARSGSAIAPARVVLRVAPGGK